jgi:hypothetical protein
VPLLGQRSPLLVAAGLSFLVGCGVLPQSGDHWYEQLEADSPCYRVNLLDGLDESSTSEVDDLFDCLNYHEHLLALQASKDALNVNSRDGVPGAIEFARTVNAVELDLSALTDTSLGMLDNPDIPADALLDMVLELLYGSPATTVRGSDFGLSSPVQLEAGVVVPLQDLIPEMAGKLLDEDLSSLHWISDIVAHEKTRDWALFANAVIEAELTTDWLWHLGDLIAASKNGANDRWQQASGDSIRDLVDATFEGSEPLIDAIQPEVTGILSDSTARRQLPAVLQQLHDEGHLQQLPMELSWMVSVNVQGESLSSGELSALASFIRLLATTNEPMSCSLDLWITSLEVDLGNVAIAFLELLADANPDVAQTSFGLLGGLLGWEFSEWALDEIAASGVCPTLTPQVMDDLQAVDVLYEPEAYSVLSSFIELMAWLKYAKTNQLYNFADLVTDLHESEAVPPAEELIRDVGTQPLMADVTDFLPTLINPAASQIDTDIQFDDLVDVLVGTLDPVDGWKNAEALLKTGLQSDDTWELLNRSALLLADSEASLQEALELIPSLIALDPDLEILDGMSEHLQNDAVLRPALRLAEIPAISERLMSSTSSEAGNEAPRAFAGRLLVDGTMDELLRILDTLLAQASELADNIAEETQ